MVKIPEVCKHDMLFDCVTREVSPNFMRHEEGSKRWQDEGVGFMEQNGLGMGWPLMKPKQIMYRPLITELWNTGLEAGGIENRSNA
jgi:hypothetical protein